MTKQEYLERCKKVFKERPIIFSGPMVRAILEGRKTQTRRVVKPQPSDYGLRWIETKEGFAAWVDKNLNLEEGRHRLCPYGQPGDRLWVRETWAPIGWDYNDNNRVSIQFRSDSFVLDFHPAETPYYSVEEQSKWKPSIHMPRWASRITLEIVKIRVERLQDISEDEAKAEGMAQGKFGWHTSIPNDGSHELIGTFAALWHRLNGPGSWDKNPWVWVIDFKRASESDKQGES